MSVVSADVLSMDELVLLLSCPGLLLFSFFFFFSVQRAELLYIIEVRA